MKTNKFMIGDWVLHDREAYQIRQLGIYGVDRDGEDYPAVCVGKPKCVGLIVERNEIEPIPLTPEILEKNGFRIEKEYDEIYDTHNYYATLSCVDLKKRNVEVNYSTFGNEITIFCHDRQNVLLSRSLETQINYVHQLQHALRLCEIEKEIEL